MRIFAGFMAFLFLICVGLQYNDPDPLLWMALYGAAAAVSIGVVLRKPVRNPAAVLGLLSLVWSLSLFIGVVGEVRLDQLAETMKAEKPAIEEAREAGGLFIVVLTMGVFLFPRKH